MINIESKIGLIEGLLPLNLIEESLFYTISKEIAVGCLAKHSSRFNFIHL